MIIFVNGAFGIGKTTVASHLRQRLAGSAIFDPELAGFVLWCLPSWIPIEGRGTDDFQNLLLWRRASILGIRLVRTARKTVIVPMAFSNVAYLREFTGSVRRFDPVVRHFCLVAPFSVVAERLLNRGKAHPVTPWQIRRARECCAGHHAPEFAEHIDTERSTPEQIASQITARL